MRLNLLLELLVLGLSLKLTYSVVEHPFCFEGAFQGHSCLFRVIAVFAPKNYGYRHLFQVHRLEVFLFEFQAIVILPAGEIANVVGR